MRVIKNGEGSEVKFTLFQTADMPDDKFAEDAKSVKHDLTVSLHRFICPECKRILNFKEVSIRLNDNGLLCLIHHL